MKTKLSKKVCKECQMNHDHWWNVYDDWAWENEDAHVVCHGFGEREHHHPWVKTTKIPDYCPYRMEHIVLGNQDED